MKIKMKGFHLLLILLFISTQSYAQSVVVGIKYFSQIMGNVHQNPARTSQVMTTVNCNHPIKVIAQTKKENTIISPKEKWMPVQVGPYEGYVMERFLSDKPVECFAERYPKFFDELNLDITEHYYWARLYDQYIEGQSRLAE